MPVSWQPEFRRSDRSWRSSQASDSFSCRIGWRNRQRMRDRADRAEVVAYRLSGWVGKVGSRVGERCQFYQKFKNTRDHSDENHPLEIRAPLKLGVRKLDEDCGIESVTSDLHYLKSGSRDIAQTGLPREVVRRLSGLENGRGGVARR
jgi:hypothetical protein